MKEKCVCFVFYTTAHCMLAPNGEPLLTAVFVGTLAKASARGGGVGGVAKQCLLEKTVAWRLSFSPAVSATSTLII